MDANEVYKKYYNEFREKLADAFPAEDIADIDRACGFAKEAHGEQLRKSGEPYIIHPISVATILLDLGIWDKAAVISALLHDVIEDTPVSFEEISEKFGEEVANIVDGVTKIGTYSSYEFSGDDEKNIYHFDNKEDEQAENIRKMFIAMSNDVRVIIVKLADRLHNMRTIKYKAPEKQRLTAKETLDIFAPIAHRLGIRQIKEELEDCAIRILDPVAYGEISEKLEAQSTSRNDFLDKIKQKIEEHVREVTDNYIVQGRIKSVHGIYRKMYMQNKTFEQIYDIYAIRIIVESKEDCWQCLGAIHDLFTPVNERFKDYTSNPKPNGYQSIHTTVVGSDGIKFEVQIRTFEMHRTAEYGVAAHWKYKLGQNDAKASKNDFESYYRWTSGMADFLKQSEDRSEVVQSIKNDIVSEEVYVLTPKGNSIALPTGSTVIDFAYAVHSDVGNRMIGAKVDGRIVPINYELKNGEKVEILTSSAPDKGPSRDWINIVRTNSARTKIRNWFKRERRDENVIEGKTRIDSEMRRNTIHFDDENSKNEFLSDIALRYDCKTVDDFYAKIGYGGILLTKATSRIFEEYNKKYKKPEPRPVQTTKKKTVSENGIIIEGIDNCLVKIAHCCNPIPGDEIIGFITRGYGVSVHKRDCPNVPDFPENESDPARWVTAYWNTRSNSEEYTSSIIIYCEDKIGMLASVTTLLANMHVMLHSCNTITKPNCKTTEKNAIALTVTVNSVDHLNTVMKRLEGLSGVYGVRRTTT